MDSEVRKSWIIRSKRARASKSDEQKTESIKPADSSWVIKAGYARNKKPVDYDKGLTLNLVHQPYRGIA